MITGLKGSNMKGHLLGLVVVGSSEHYIKGDFAATLDDPFKRGLAGFDAQSGTLPLLQGLFVYEV